MSEYQYYEFQAIDRPLSEKDMRHLRSYSTRADITPTSFTNEYEWGNFKGDENAWMRKYFDAFLYFANWGTRILKLRLPDSVLNLKTAKEYCTGNHTEAEGFKGKVIITIAVDFDGGGVRRARPPGDLPRNEPQVIGGIQGTAEAVFRQTQCRGAAL